MDGDFAVIAQPERSLHQYNTNDGSKDLMGVLEHVQKLTVQQHLDAFEVGMGWERNNRYSIYNEDKVQIFYMYEAAQCYARQCYGSLRELKLILTDNDDNRFLELERPLRCCSRCCFACCHLQEMNIALQLPSKQLIGTVKEKWSCVTPQYVIEDIDGSDSFRIVGSLCHLRCCCSISFDVLDAEEKCVSSIKSKWGGCAGIIGAFNKYTISYCKEVSSIDKVKILSAAFLLDFNYFQRHGKCF